MKANERKDKILMKNGILLIARQNYSRIAALQVPI